MLRNLIGGGSCCAKVWEFIEFVKDYITNPSKDKGVCKPAAYSFFGVMPPIGQGMPEADKEAVAYWMYHRYSENWQEIFGEVKKLQDLRNLKRVEAE